MILIGWFCLKAFLECCSAADKPPTWSFCLAVTHRDPLLTSLFGHQIFVHKAVIMDLSVDATFKNLIVVTLNMTYEDFLLVHNNSNTQQNAGLTQYIQ